MKHLKIFTILCLVVMVCLFSSCAPEEQPIDESMLIGKWQSGTLYEKYEYNHTYTTWDISDSVNGIKVKEYFWALDHNILDQIFIRGINIFEHYTIITLNATTLKYEDDFGNQKTFIKVQ